MLTDEKRELRKTALETTSRIYSALDRELERRELAKPEDERETIQELRALYSELYINSVHQTEKLARMDS